MTMWDVLGIEETKDESVIKKAYRKLIRIHHPEDDPDGFQRARQAYEDALRYLSSADVPDEVKNDAVPAASESQTQSAEVIQFDEILADAEKRMTVDVWRQWAESIMLLPIDQQEDISKHALRAVMGNRWLPPAVIQTLWESLGWESFHRGTDELQEVGEFLDDWRTQPFILSLEELQALSQAEQRAILGFLRPQEIALSIGQPEAIEYLFSQHIVAAYIPRKETELVLLKSLIASRNRSRAVLIELVERFCGNMASSLTTEQWSLVADAALLCQREELIDVVSEKLLEQKAIPRWQIFF
ncbi:DnaJ domain-containing protein [Enterovibrio coralii]|uniref:J domain-containing protein n=1 Tax=Enterovibrio coralii TaxID=294935 RepID=A0A135ID74_9GAMM|nr:DnaJ domain-containing protein [Enterovibrio coralii]KXF83410.1 hypothetical protein ATN88_07120 [Enterovibrio coralii]